MATLFYILFVIFNHHVGFNLGWFLISLIFSLAWDGTRVIYKYTSDKNLAGHEDII